jgi:pimeloyl-ACP methyl ester carboxylesterase
VLLHGWGGGVGLWSMNLDALSREYEVIAIDLLGFGRSTRQQYKGSTADDAIAYWINSLEQWRINIGIQHMILVGHSLGSYIALNYSLSYPSRVTRLISLCPFGIIMPTPPRQQLPWYWLFILRLMKLTSPQTMVRMIGPLGPSLMYRFRGGEDARYQSLYGDNDKRVSDYAYHLTVAPTGGGDYAFQSLVHDLVLRQAVKPLWYDISLSSCWHAIMSCSCFVSVSLAFICWLGHTNDNSNQLSSLSIPVTMIYGQHDPVVSHTGDLLQSMV